MALWHLGVDQHQGLTLPNGRIAKMNRRRATIRDATYTGNRLSNIDDAAAGWDDDCVPGWFFINSAVESSFSTGLGGMINKGIELHQQLLSWDDDVTYHGPGHPDWQRAYAHDALSSAHGHIYLTLTDTAISVADRTTYLETMLGGASDGQGGRIASAVGYYAGFRAQPAAGTFRDGGYPERVVDPDDSSNTIPQFWAWVDPGTPGTALHLGELNAKSGNIPANILLGRGADWHASITA